MQPIVLALALSLFFKSFAQKGAAVNAVLGDASFIDRFQKPPDEETNETVRLETHLAYVERLLQNKSVSH